MKLLTSTMKMADAIHMNHLLIPVVHRFGIRLGFGDKTIQAVCSEHQVDVDFFLAVVNAFNNERSLLDGTKQTFHVPMVLRYLTKTHQYYLKVLVPIIEQHLHVLLASSAKLRPVKKFFREYKKELKAHFAQEENVTFPYAAEVYRRYRNRETIETQPPLPYSMKAYKSEHSDLDEKLFDLKNILIKYIGRDYDETALASLLFELFRLEKDIQDHTRIENNILMPIVADMEDALVRSKAARHARR